MSPSSKKNLYTSINCDDLGSESEREFGLCRLLGGCEVPVTLTIVWTGASLALLIVGGILGRRFTVGYASKGNWREFGEISGYGSERVEVGRNGNPYRRRRLCFDAVKGHSAWDTRTKTDYGRPWCCFHHCWNYQMVQKSTRAIG
ncbi:uncharacterized protein EV420DRAFT_1477885 [Desarmillaria tabescens]|uniref:Uncharacterized protein n=1 Tax=Armillaria tabescens TaxID=1929756 RepID=A0AA39N8M4_ARMTA|nr:uncharacterized protein EV420DRAFT_1477885 [Desarmillaria tabescens]KAK0461028.1 hypothetical protein EV420DRAFT_1477885 [Desarmillaria tabescens]